MTLFFNFWPYFTVTSGSQRGCHARSLFQAHTQKTNADCLMHTHPVDLNADRFWKKDAVTPANIPHPGTGDQCGLLWLQTQ